MINLNNEMSEEEKRLADAFIYLISCAVNDRAPELGNVETVDLEKLYHLAKRHSLLAACSMALEQTSVLQNCNPQLTKNWMEEKNKAIRKNIMLDAERAEICSYMERAGIWYMPLKGIILKDYYPKLGMRQMADNDILYDAAYQNQLKNFMESRGYKAESVGKSIHDVYMKPPIYNFEMHTALYGNGHPEGWEEYYREVKNRLLPNREEGYEFHFRDEDFYIYILSHAYKHYQGGGTGLRTLVDIYVYLKQMEKRLNWNYIGMELDVLHLVEFEQETRQLCRKVFSMEKAELTNRENQLIAYYMGSGTYGSMKNRIRNKLREEQPDEAPITNATKCKYIVKRLFPNMDYYRQYVPFVYRHKYLIPGFVVYRIVRGILTKGRKIVYEIQTLNKLG